MLAGCQLVFCQRFLDFRSGLIVLLDGWSCLDLRDEMWLSLITGFGQMHLIPHPMNSHSGRADQKGSGSTPQQAAFLSSLGAGSALLR